MQDKLYWTSEDWTPELEGLTSRYEMTPEKIADYRLTQMAWFNDGNSVSRFTAVYGPLYMVRLRVKNITFLNCIVIVWC